MSEEFVGNKTWSVKVRRSFILARDIDFVHVPGGKDVGTRAEDMWTLSWMTSMNALASGNHKRFLFEKSFDGAGAIRG
eukprot:scaffold27682_cov49-Attheya_sp.AAC.1